MAKVFVSCDEYIYRCNGRYYARSKDKYDFYHRYTRVFEQMRLAVRCEDVDTVPDNYVPMDEDPAVELYPLPIFHGPKEYAHRYFETGRVMRGAVKGCDAAILRLPSTVAQRFVKQIWRCGIPYALEIVYDSYDGAMCMRRWYNRLLWLRIDKKVRRACYKADGVSCVTEHYLQQRYFSKKNPHFEGYYSSLSLDRSFFSSARIYPEKDTLTIAHVSNQIGLHSRKGTDIVMQALSKLKKEGVVLNVIFAGDDWSGATAKIMAYARELDIEDQVNCPGFLSRKQMNDLLDNSDLYVMPTKAEGLPRVVIEAIAKGLPTVTAPASGTPELIPAEYLVEYSDVDGLAEKIRRLATNKDAYEEASRTNFNHSLEYEASILQARRDEFYGKLKKMAEK